MKRNGFTKVELVVVLVIFGVVAILLYPAFSPRPDRSGITCVNNLKQIGSALQQYVQEFDEKLPPVALGSTAQSSYGWLDSTRTYLQDPSVFQCPKEGKGPVTVTDPTQRGFTDYWYNANLSAVKLTRITDPKRTLMAGEGNDGSELTDGRYSLFALPDSWLNDQDSPSYRHRGTANYLFSDGHVKSLKPQQISTQASMDSVATFALR